MGMLHRARKVLSDLLRRDRFEREMDEEVQTFLEMDARDRERAGASPAEARRAVRARFGGVETSKEYARDARVGAWLESARRDVLLAVRLLARSPAFSTAAVLTIALGAVPVAVTAAMANWIFFAPAPGVTGADRLVRVEIVTRGEEGDTERAELSFAEHAVLRRAVRSFDGLAGHRGNSTSVSVPGVDALHVDYTAVSYDYFEVLGMRMAAGRSFTPAEDRPAANATVAVLGYDLAEALFGDPRGAPGRRVLVHGLDFMVVGVAPPDFRGLKNDHYPRLFLPGAAPSSNRAASRVAAPRFEEFMARLAGGVEVERARAELTTAVRSLAAAELPDSDRFRTASVVVERQPGMAFSSRHTRGEVVFMISMIATAGALLLVLAGANLGNLLLFRVARRREETALRRALGASRWRLVRAHLIDVTLLTLAGGGVALLCTFWLGVAFGGVGIPEAGYLRLPIDWRVGGTVLVASLLMGLVFGGLPGVLAASSAGLQPAVARLGLRRGQRWRGPLTVIQLAVSLALLVGAGLLLATVRNLVRVDVGFDPALVAVAQVLPHDNGYDAPRALALYRGAIERASAAPGVAAAAVSGDAPFSSLPRMSLRLPETESTEAVRAGSNNVSPDYFRVLGLPLLKGRAFTAGEAFTTAADGCGPVILSASLASRLFGSRDALGQTVVGSTTQTASGCVVVGVVGDVRSRPSGEWEPVVYRPLGRGLVIRNSLLARSMIGSAAAIDALRDGVSAIDPAVPLRTARSLEDVRAFQMAGQRIISWVLGVLASMGLMLAAVGLYGLVAETVIDRTREFAIRTAIGAAPSRILASVVGRAAWLAAIGLVAGGLLAAGLGHALRSQLFGVDALEPGIVLSAAGVLAGVVLLASLAPALRAARVNPVDVLRAD